MSIVTDIYNIANPDNPAAKLAAQNAANTSEALRLAELQSSQGSATPSWVPWTIGGSVLLLVVVVFFYLRSRKK